MPDLPISMEQLGIILFFGGFAVWAIRWAGRNLRAQIGSGGGKRIALQQAEIDVIVARGLATPVQLFTMSPEEQRLLAHTARGLAAAAAAAPVVGAAPGPASPVAEGPPPTHCPACGARVDGFPREVPWRAACGGCGAALVLRRDGPRLVLTWTPRG